METKNVRELNELWKSIKSKEIMPKTERELNLEKRIVELETEVAQLKSEKVLNDR